MKINELKIDKQDLAIDNSSSKFKLDGEDNIYSALNLFLRSKANSLVVYKNEEQIGILHIATLTECVYNDFLKEREKRVQLSISVNRSITKLKTLIEKVSNTTNKSIRNSLIQSLQNTINLSLENLEMPDYE